MTEPSSLSDLLTQADTALYPKSQLSAYHKVMEHASQDAARIRLERLRGEILSRLTVKIGTELGPLLTLAATHDAQVRADLRELLHANPRKDVARAALLLSGQPADDDHWGEATPPLHELAHSWARLHAAGLTGEFPAQLREQLNAHLKTHGPGGENPWQLNLNLVPARAREQVADLWSNGRFIQGPGDLTMRLSANVHPLPPRLKNTAFGDLPKWARTKLERAEHALVPAQDDLSDGLAPTPAPPMSARWAIQQDDAPEAVVREAELTFTRAAALLAQAWSGSPDELKADVARATRGQRHPALLAALHAPLIVTGTFPEDMRKTPGLTRDHQNDAARLIWGGWTWLRRTLSADRPSDDWLMVPQQATHGPGDRRASLSRCGAPDAHGLALALMVACGEPYLFSHCDARNALPVNMMCMQICQWLAASYLKRTGRTPLSPERPYLPWPIKPIPTEASFHSEKLATLLQQADQERSAEQERSGEVA